MMATGFIKRMIFIPLPNPYKFSEPEREVMVCDPLTLVELPQWLYSTAGLHLTVLYRTLSIRISGSTHGSPLSIDRSLHHNW